MSFCLCSTELQLKQIFPFFLRMVRSALLVLGVGWFSHKSCKLASSAQTPMVRIFVDWDTLLKKAQQNHSWSQEQGPSSSGKHFIGRVRPAPARPVWYVNDSILLFSRQFLLHILMTSINKHRNTHYYPKCIPKSTDRARALDVLTAVTSFFLGLGSCCNICGKLHWMAHSALTLSVLLGVHLGYLDVCLCSSLGWVLVGLLCCQRSDLHSSCFLVLPRYLCSGIQEPFL